MSLIRSNAPHVVILGGGYAGALSALRLSGRSGARITLVNAAPHFVERIRLHQLAAGQRLVPRPLDALLAGTGVNLLIGKVVEIDAAAQRAHVEQPDGSRLAVAWDYLMYALGSGSGSHGLAGAEHLHAVAGESGAQKLAAHLSALPSGARVAVIGGGLTGIETASELAESIPRLRLSLLSSGELAPGLSLAGRDYVRSSLRALGVELREGVTVLGAERDALILRQGPLPTAAAVWCAGFSTSPIASRSGLPISERGQLRVDAHLRVPGHPNIFGCGDGVRALRDGSELRMACATAMPMAAHAADNLTSLLRGRPLRPFGFSFFIQCISLGRRRGIVQRVGPDDAPRDFFVEGGLAARLKEAVCRFTVLSLTIERRLAGTYTWPGRRRAPVVEPVANLVS
jgi:NADH dehydrogenase